MERPEFGADVTGRTGCRERGFTAGGGTRSGRPVGGTGGAPAGSEGGGTRRPSVGALPLTGGERYWGGALSGNVEVLF